MDFKIVTSKSNVFYKKIKKLLEKKYIDKEKLFLSEGIKLLEIDKNPEFIIISNDIINLEFPKAIPVYKFSQELFNDISSQENSQGVIIGHKIKEFNINECLEDIIILDKIQDPGNVGTIIRTLDSAGFKNVMLTKGSVDIYNEKSVRSSMGSVFNIKPIYLEISELINHLKINNYNIISTSLSQRSVNYSEMKTFEKNAIIFGNEGNGISNELLEISDQEVIIPIYGKNESLNVGVAVGIILYKFREIESNGI